MEVLREAVEQRVSEEGQAPFVSRLEEVSLGDVRSVLAGRASKGSTIQKICDAIGLEFYIGPPREGSVHVPDRPPTGQAPQTHPVDETRASPGRLLVLLGEFFDELPDECSLAGPGRECALLEQLKEMQRRR